MKKQQKRANTHIYNIEWTSYIRSGKTDQITKKEQQTYLQKFLFCFL